MQRRGRAVGVDVALTTLALASSGMVPFSFNLIVARMYGPTVLGEVSVVLGLAFFLGQIPAAFTIAAATKFLAEALGRGEEGAARTIFHFLLVVSVGLVSVLAAGLVAGAPLLALALHVHVSAVLLMAGLVLAYTLYLFFKSAYYGTQRVGRYVGNEIVSDVLFFVLLAVVLLVHATPWLLAPFVLNNVVFVARAAHDLAPYFRHFDWGRAAPQRAILCYCALAGAGTIASVGRTLLSPAVAGLFLSHRAVGLYAAASAMANPLSLLPHALSLVLFAAMARLHGAGEAASVRDLFQRSTAWLVVSLGVVCGLVVINATFALSLLYGSEYEQAATTLQLIVFGTYLSMISGPSVYALSSTAYVKIPTVASVGGFAASLIAWFLLIPHLGIAGVALGFVIGAVVTGGVPAYFAARLLGASPVSFLRGGTLAISLMGLLLLVGRTPLVASASFLGVIVLLYAGPVSLARTRRRDEGSVDQISSARPSNKW